MSVCNLFKKLSKETGNFLMFSQYTDDLTKYLVRHNDAKAIPSRFIAMNIDYSKLNSKLASLGLKTDPSEGLPNLLQNYFENACAFFRDAKVDDESVVPGGWTPEVSRRIFWNVMREDILSDPHDWDSEAVSGDNTGLKYYDELVYRGDINIQSYTEEDNIGYNEIYCYIPNDVAKTKYCVKLNDVVNLVDYNRSYIEGYNENDEDFTGLLKISIPEGTQYTYDETLSLLDENDEDLESIPLDDKSFKFNTILVLYDVYVSTGTGDDEVKYKDIPMGLYLTGLINNEGQTTNYITKYVSNDDIYGAGTSYGLRIATRFVATPNSTSIDEIAIDSEANYADFAKVMSSFSETQAKMDEILATINEDNLGIKNHLSNFKNYRTNIPYIIKVGDTNYWFVNGKNTNVPVTGADGAQGVTGPRGPRGYYGLIGPQGVTGPKGADGGPGVQGITGEKGPDGVQGITGAPGPRGITGAPGAPGVQGITGVRGSEGPEGPQGVQGVTGVQGITGPRGITGVQGLTGEQGVQGITGVQGEQGITGEQGVQGITGVQGPAGISIGESYRFTAGDIKLYSGPIRGQGVTGAISAIGNTTDVIINRDPVRNIYNLDLSMMCLAANVNWSDFMSAGDWLANGDSWCGPLAIHVYDNKHDNMHRLQDGYGVVHIIHSSQWTSGAEVDRRIVVEAHASVDELSWSSVFTNGAQFEFDLEK